MKLRNKKTGEVFDALIREKGGLGLYKHMVFDIKAYKHDGCIKAGALGEFNSLAELNEEWEDYTLKEPLIKDEKIRKLVKEWATLFEEHRKIKYYEYNDFVAFRLCREKGTPDPELDIRIDYELVNLREGYEYDFEELCGEEKECES